MNAPADSIARPLSPSALAVLAALRALATTHGRTLHVRPSELVAGMPASTARAAVAALRAVELVREVSRATKHAPAVLELTDLGADSTLDACRSALKVSADSALSRPPPYGGGGRSALTSSSSPPSQSQASDIRTAPETSTTTRPSSVLGVDLWKDHTADEWIRVGASAEALLRLFPEENRMHPHAYRRMWKPERVRAVLHHVAWSLLEPGRSPVMVPPALFASMCKNTDRQLREHSDIGVDSFLLQFVQKKGHPLPRFMEDGYGQRCIELGYAPRRPAGAATTPKASAPAAPVVDFARVKARAVEIGSAIRWAAHFEAQRACKGAPSTEESLRRLEQEGRSMGWEG